MESIYPHVLFLHSLLRYVLIISAIYAIFRSWRGWLNNKPYSLADNKAGLYLIIVAHTQLLLGLFLYFFLSPYVKSGLSDMKQAMKSGLLRFWTVEHFFAMVVAIALFQVGRSLSKKAPTEVSKHKRAAIFYTMAFLLMIFMIPWPFLRETPYFGTFARTNWITILF